MLTFRPAREADAQACWDIRVEAIRAGCSRVYSPEQIRIWTSDSPSPAYAAMVERHYQLASIEQQIVGIGMIDLQSGKVDAIFIRPTFMGLGVGRQMLAHLEQLARERHLHQVSLESTLNAAPFYRHCGYAGEQIATYESPLGISLDCVPMSKTLHHSFEQ